MARYEHITYKEFREWVQQKCFTGFLDAYCFQLCFKIMDDVEGHWFFLRERYWKKRYEQFVLNEIVNS